MESTRSIFFGILAASLTFGPSAVAQAVVRPVPTAADWAALAKRPDFTGVWETGGGGAGVAVDEARHRLGVLARRRRLLEAAHPRVVEVAEEDREEGPL